MKVIQENKPIQRSDNFKETRFKFAQSAFAAEILSSSLYTDTKLAVVRELSTNAMDTQVEAGNGDRPFDVHLPNALDPYFAIRDYGLGLPSEEFAKAIFGDWDEEECDHENLAPYAVETHQGMKFSVARCESCGRPIPVTVEGVYATYFASTRRDSDDFMGSLGLGSKSPFSYTDMFSITSFFNGTEFTYSAYKDQEGYPCVSLLTVEPTDEENGVAIHINVKPDDVYAFQDKAHKVYRVFNPKPNITGARLEWETEKTPMMTGDGWELYDGPSGYGNKITVIMGNVAYAASRSEITHRLGTDATLVLRVPLGECKNAANREELQYNERTTKNLQKRVDQACAKIRRMVTDDLENCNSLLERLVALKKFYRLIDLPSKSKTIPTSRKGIYLLRKLELKRGGKLFIGYDRFNNYLRPSDGSKYTFIECDVDGDGIKQKHKNALRHWMQNQTDLGQVYLATIKDANKFRKILGEPAAVLTQLPPPPRTHGGGGTGTRTFIKRVNHWSRSRRSSEAWDKVDDINDVDTETGIAVPRQGYRALWNNNPRDADTVHEYAHSIGYAEVYGLPVNRYDKLREELGLKDLYTEIKKSLTEWVETADDFQRAAFHHDQYHKYDDKLLESIKNASPTCKNLIQFLETPNVPYFWSHLFEAFDLEVPAAPNYLDIFRQAYPLIASIDPRYVNQQDVIEYVQLKEKNNV